MTPEIVLLITFDYEVFLGRNFAPAQEVLFGPTDELLELCKELGVRATFFADVCSVWAHRRAGLHAYADAFEAQLRAARHAGHDVQLHLHPHWLASTYERGEWRIATDRMYLAELGFGDGPDAAPAVVRRGIAYLNELLRPVDPAYRCLAFRAAGLALGPRERETIAALLDAGIVLDASVAKGLRLRMDTISVDYRSAPARANWHMAPEGGVTRDSTHGLFEVPIATFRSDSRTRLRFLLRRALSVGRLRGTGISRSARQTRLANLGTLLLGNLRYLAGDPVFLLSCDTKGFDAPMILDGFARYVDAHSAERRIAVSLLSHPKLMFAPERELFRVFIDGVRARYGLSLSLATATDVALA
ncbi:MAG: hypothetical protein AUI57_00435 [Candidatus Rokubacteria bacterium 13_1_40CM_2_68_8]|nr:MAG: hypothetical protein AUI57_00435 [Candidatus Rokubacteria bacterium 13_1_40CM_2_68_8]